MSEYSNLFNFLLKTAFTHDTEKNSFTLLIIFQTKLYFYVKKLTCTNSFRINIK